MPRPLQTISSRIAGRVDVNGKGTHSEIQFVVEAVDFNRVFEISAVAKNLIFGLQ